MAERRAPREPAEGQGELRHPAAPEASEVAARTTDPGGLIEQIAVALNDPPVGLLLIGWEPPGVATTLDQTELDELEELEELATSYRLQVERSIIFAVTSCAGRSDRILASAEAEVAIIRSAMRGPATAEALASRLATQLEAELGRLAVDAGEPTIRWAVGLAVGRQGDAATDLLRLAERALGDAWLLGGRRPGLA